MIAPPRRLPESRRASGLQFLTQERAARYGLQRMLVLDAARLVARPGPTPEVWVDGSSAPLDLLSTAVRGGIVFG